MVLKTEKREAAHLRQHGTERPNTGVAALIAARDHVTIGRGHVAGVAGTVLGGRPVVGVTIQRNRERPFSVDLIDTSDSVIVLSKERYNITEFATSRKIPIALIVSYSMEAPAAASRRIVARQITICYRGCCCLSWDCYNLDALVCHINLSIISTAIARAILIVAKLNIMFILIRNIKGITFSLSLHTFHVFFERFFGTCRIKFADIQIIVIVFTITFTSKYNFASFT